MKIIMNEKMYDVNEVAKKLGINPVTVRKMIHRGELPSNKIGKSFAISETGLKKFLRGETKSVTIPNTEDDITNGSQLNDNIKPSNTPKNAKSQPAVKPEAPKLSRIDEIERRKAQREQNKREYRAKQAVKVMDLIGSKISEKINNDKPLY